MRDSAEPAGACIQPQRSPRPLLLGARVSPLHIGVLSLAILGLDFVTGPYIQVAILFVVPVALATWSGGLGRGTVVAVALPLVRLPFFFVWEVSSSWALEAADTAVDVVVLLAMVWVIQYIARQQREIQVLEGLLPIYRALHQRPLSRQIHPHLLPGLRATALRQTRRIGAMGYELCAMSYSSTRSTPMTAMSYAGHRRSPWPIANSQ